MVRDVFLYNSDKHNMSTYVTGNITSTHQVLRTLLWYNLRHTKGTSVRTRSQNTRYMAQSKLTMNFLGAKYMAQANLSHAHSLLLRRLQKCSFIQQTFNTGIQQVTDYHSTHAYTHSSLPYRIIS